MKTLEEIHKEYRLAKIQHCDDCNDEECQTCKPEFDKLRKEERNILDNIKCNNCGRHGFRNIDRRNNKTICITCGFVLSEKEVGCRKELNAYSLCGDIGFNNKLLLCEECLKSENSEVKE